MVDHRTGVVDVDDGLFLHGGIVAAAVGIDDGAAHDFEIGLVLLGQVEAYFAWFGCYLCYGSGMVVSVVDGVGHLAARCVGGGIVEVTVTTAEELSDIDFLGRGVGLHVGGALAVCRVVGVVGCGCYLFCRISCTQCPGADAHIAIEGIIDVVLLKIGCIRCIALHGCKLGGHRFVHCCCRAYLTGDVVTAIDLVDNDIVGRARGGFLAIDMYEGIAAHVGHTSASEDAASWIRHGTCRAFFHSTDVAGLHRHLRAAAHVGLVATAIDVAAYLRSLSLG